MVSRLVPQVETIRVGIGYSLELVVGVREKACWVLGNMEKDFLGIEAHEGGKMGLVQDALADWSEGCVDRFGRKWMPQLGEGS